MVLALISGIIVYYGVLLGVEALYPRKYGNEITETAKKYKMEPALLFALVRTESGFDPNAVSDAGAKGLTQITPETFSWLQTKTGEKLAEDKLFDPAVSVHYGAFFLSALLNEFGDIPTALAAYHAGRGQVNKWLTDKTLSADGKKLCSIPSDATKRYVNKVMRAYEKYKNIYKEEVVTIGKRGCLERKIIL